MDEIEETKRHLDDLIANQEAFIESVFDRQARGVGTSKPVNMLKEQARLGELMSARAAL